MVDFVKSRTIPIGARTLSGTLTPDWRHQWAVKLACSGRYATKKSNDALTIRYVEFLRAVLRYTTNRGMRILAKKQPTLFLAQKVSEESTLRPLEIKARALAGQSDRAIARAVGLPVRALAAYLGLFFDVRDNLAAGPWIKWTVLGLHPDQPPSVETLALWHCWQRGLTLVEPWFDFLQHQGEPHDLATEIGRQRASIQLLVDIRQLPETPETRSSLLKKYAYLTSSLAENSKSMSLAGVISRNEAKILGQITWKQPEREEFLLGTYCEEATGSGRERESGEYGKAG